MAATKNQKLKVLAIMRMLERETSADRGLTMPQIIERLAERGIDAERKSVYRDLQVLRDFGCDVVTIPGRPVSYAIRRNELGLSDVMLLIDAVQSTRFLTERKSNQLVRSLKHLVSESEAELLDKRVHVQGRIKSQTESVFGNVDIIHAALQQRRKISFLYFKYDTKLSRTSRREGKLYIETPVKLVYADGFYYAVVFNDKYDDFAVYRVDRMRLLQVSDEPATRNERIANYGFSDFEHQSFGMFKGDLESVTLRVQPDFMDVIVDRFGLDVTIVESDDEHADVLVPVRKSAQFFGWVAGLNGGVTIKAPARVREEYRAWLQELARQ